MSSILRNLVVYMEWNLRAGMSAKEAVDDVAERFGISKDGRGYEYLLERADMEIYNFQPERRMR